MASNSSSQLRLFAGIAQRALSQGSASTSGRSFSSAAPAAVQQGQSWFSHVELAPKDPILGVTERFLADKDPLKMNLGVVGGYCLQLLGVNRSYKECLSLAQPGEENCVESVP